MFKGRLKGNGAAVEQQRPATHLDIVDTYRGLAAIYVLLFHASAEIKGQPAAAFMNYGVQAVLLFFVISGVCIHLGQAKAIASGQAETFGISKFAAKRFWRIYPPFAAAVLLTLAIDGIGHALYPDFYKGLIIGIGQDLRAATSTLPVIVGNFLCLQPQIPVVGTNGPLWSLGYEAVFYVLYPAYFLASRRLGPWITPALVCGVSAVALAAYQPLRLVLPFHILALWNIWAFGGLIADRLAGRTNFPVGPIIGLGAFLALAYCVAGPPLFSATVQSWLWGVGFSGFVAWSVLSKDAGAQLVRRMLRPLRVTARFSFSLYLIQAPVLVLIRAALAAGDISLASGWMRFGLEVAVGLATALVFYALVERRFNGRTFALSGRAPFLVATT